MIFLNKGMLFSYPQSDSGAVDIKRNTWYYYLLLLFNLPQGRKNMAYRNRGDSEDGFKGVFERRVKNAQMRVVMLILAATIGWPMIIGSIFAYSLTHNYQTVIAGGAVALALGECIFMYAIPKARKRHELALREFKKKFPPTKPNSN